MLSLLSVIAVRFGLGTKCSFVESNAVKWSVDDNKDNQIAHQQNLEVKKHTMDCGKNGKPERQYENTAKEKETTKKIRRNFNRCG